MLKVNQWNLWFVTYLPQHFLYFLPLPHGHGSFRPTFLSFLSTFTGRGNTSSLGNNSMDVCPLRNHSRVLFINSTNLSISAFSVSILSNSRISDKKLRTSLGP